MTLGRKAVQKYFGNPTREIANADRVTIETAPRASARNANSGTSGTQLHRA
jgi:hypothetical protein